MQLMKMRREGEKTLKTLHCLKWQEHLWQWLSATLKGCSPVRTTLPILQWQEFGYKGMHIFVLYEMLKMSSNFNINTTDNLMYFL